jgi:hypothetical protein
MNLDEVEYCTQNWNPDDSTYAGRDTEVRRDRKIPQTFQKFVVKEKKRQKWR